MKKNKSCWAVINGVPVQQVSLAKMALHLGSTMRDIYNANSKTGDGYCFWVNDIKITMGNIPARIKIQGEPLRHFNFPQAPGGPLLRGHCTHRLGYSEA